MKKLRRYSYKGIFITGTDTGVGKTRVACLIVKEMRSRNVSIGVMKPISSGGREDAVTLKKASGVDDSLDDINPVYFKNALAPWVASRVERKKLNFSSILKSYRKLCRRHNFLLVEGAGGLFVPITEKLYMADLARMFGLPLVIVSRPGLGSINHTLLTIRCARQHGLKVLGFIMNYTSRSRRGLAEKTNPGVISRLGRVRFLGEVPYEKSS